MHPVLFYMKDYNMYDDIHMITYDDVWWDMIKYDNMCDDVYGGMKQGRTPPGAAADGGEHFLLLTNSSYSS